METGNIPSSKIPTTSTSCSNEESNKNPSSASIQQSNELYSFEIQVSPPFRTWKFLSSHIEYKVTTRTTSPQYKNVECSVNRRFRDFLWLYNRLVLDHPGVIIPPVPEKHAIGRFEDEFIETRRLALERFLNKATSHPKLQNNKHLQMFLESETFRADKKKEEIVGQVNINVPPFRFESTVLPMNLAEKTNLEKRGFSNFITHSNGKLYDGNKEFRFFSFNVPGFLLLEDKPKCRSTLFGYPTCQYTTIPLERDEYGYGWAYENGQACIIDPVPCTNSWHWLPPDPFEQESAAAAVAGMQGKVIRTFTLGFGPGHHITGIRQFNEAAFVAFDRALDIARRYSIRLIIPLINNYWGDESAYGTYAQFTKFYGKSPPAFFTDSQIRADFKYCISWILNRYNTINGIRYGDDPTVLAWQIGNELGSWEDPIPPAEWTIDIATLIKQHAPNTLVGDGSMGGGNLSKRLHPSVLKHPCIDLFTSHYYYGASDLKRVDRDARFVSSYGKVFLIGEYGLCEKQVYGPLLEKAWQNTRVAGALIWSLRYHSADGGFHIHQEHSGQWSYHVPGFYIDKTIQGWDEQELYLVNLIRDYALKSSGLPADTPYPIPAPPGEIKDVNPYQLRWRGSVWAAKYAIYRGTCSLPTCAAPDKWTLLSTEVKDNVNSGNTIYSDKGVVKGEQYWYWVFPISVQGVVGQGTLIGPYKA